MAFRKTIKLMSAAVVAALFVASSACSASDQQVLVPADGGCPGCAAAANPFPISQSLPTSSFETSTYDGTVISDQVFGTYDNLLPATYATGTIVSGGTLSEPIGTLTLLSAAPAVSPVSIAPATQPVYYSSPVAAAPATYSSASTASSGLAQTKAVQAANGGVRGHIGGSLGGAKYEGVGWSSISPQSAIQHCCYWGTRPVAEIGVSRGQDGLWYACVLYN